jgi:hypothetical protein
MAIDQRNISSQLRMMDDRALQRYAAMHKSDPYIFPLAFQESQNRQKIRMSGQAQMGGQEMPKVNDAALMAMAQQAAPPQAPQGQGISNLPAPNMQRMADGGIAGYEDDEEGMATGGMGGMFNFAQQSEPVVRMSNGGSTRFTPGGAAYPARFATPDIDSYGQDSVMDEFAGIDEQIIANMENQKMLGAFDDYSASTPKPKKGSKAAKKLEEDKKEAKKEVKKEEPAKPKVELPALQTYTASTPAQIRATADTMARPDLEEIQASYKPFAEQFAQDRTRIEGREKNNLSDALIRGGLKALGGKSQYAMQNISEGGLEGLNAYQEGIRTNDAARKALTQSEMLMAQAQRAERQGARKDAVQLTNQAEQAKQTAVQLSNTARQIMSTEEFQRGQTEVSLRNAATAEQNALTSGRMAGAAELQAQAAMSRASALGASGAKGALTEAQLARIRDTAYDNVTKNDNFNLDKLKAEAAAKKAGKPFNAATWQAELVDAEVERLLANTSRGAKIDTSAAPTGGKLGSGTFNLSGWGQPQVVTPK